MTQKVGARKRIFHARRPGMVVIPVQDWHFAAAEEELGGYGPEVVVCFCWCLGVGVAG